MQSSKTDFSTRVKGVVRKNFNQSVNIYREFEEKTHFFYTLAETLARWMEIPEGGTVLDVGCGNGASCQALRECCRATVIGIDLSEAMIVDARHRIQDPYVHLIVGDGETLHAMARSLRCDAVTYNAALFVFPNPETSLAHAQAFLKPGGTLGFSFYPRVYGAGSDDLIGWAFEQRGWPLPRFRTITPWEKACGALESLFGSYETSTQEMEGTIPFLIDFFSIPAQSASLFPKIPYQERAEKVRYLFEALKELQEPFTIGWDMAKAWNIPPA